MPAPVRMLPELTPETTAFWTGGAQGKLRIGRCQACSYWIHPPMPVCPHCLSREVRAEAVSGLGVVHSFTVNYQAFQPDTPVPFAIAIVELPEQEGLRLTTNIVGFAPEAVQIGMAVQVQFLCQEDVWLPLFAPARDDKKESVLF